MSAAAAAVAAARDDDDAVDGGAGSGSAKALIRVHRCRFADWQPAAVVSLAVSSSGRRMAVGRQSGDIEIWNVSQGFYCQRVIPGSGEPTVQVLAWVKGGTGESGEEDGERLISAGLNARVIEWDLQRLLPKSASDSYGGAVWCGALSRAGDRLALGCEDGSIRVFDVTDRGTGSSAPAYACALLGHTGRVLSVAWSHDGAQLVSGGSDSTIRQWAVASQRNTARITVETLGKEKTLVWAVKLLRDNTVVSGDSLGHVQFWDARFGTLLHSFAQHQADVLALAVTPSENAVYASGADNKVVEFRRVPHHQHQSPAAAAAADGGVASTAATAGTKWVVTAGQRPHTHDVHALAIIPRVVTVASSSSSSAAAAAATAADAKAKPSSSSHAAAAAAASSGAQRVSQHLLVSGGVDTQLCVYHCQSFQHKPHKILPFPHRSPVSLAVPQRMFLMHQHRRLEMWELGRATTESELSTTGGANVREGTAIATASTYNHVLTINTSSVLHLCCSALAPNARWAVCSDPIKLRLFALTPNEDNSSAFDVRPVDVSAKLPPAYSVLFSPDSSRLFVATLDSTVVVFDLNQQKVVGTFAQHTAQDDDDDSDSDADADGDAKSGAVAKAKNAKSALTALPHADEAGVIHTLAVSSDGQWLASGDHFNRLHVFNLDAMQHHATLPVFESPHLAMAFQPHASVLAVTCASNAVYVYDVEERRLTDWSRDNSHALPRQLVARSDKVVGVSFDGARPNVLLLHAHSFVCHVDLDKPIAPLALTAVPSALAALGLSGPADPKANAAVGGKRSHGAAAQTPAKAAKTSANGSATDGAAARGSSAVAATPATAKAAGAGAGVPATGSKQSLSAIAQSLQATRAQLQRQKDDAAADTNFRIVERYRPLLHAQYVSAPASASSSSSDSAAAAAAAAAAGAGAGSSSGSELLVVEVPWLKVMQTFPDPLYRHKYGS